jgi:hypothetical protein
MKAMVSVAWLLAAATALASCGGDDGSGLTPVASNEAPPNFINYPDPNMFIQGVPITPLVPTITGGMPTNYLVQPDLPAGLRLDAEGRITGTPTQSAAPATYIVTAGNSAGTTSFGVRITVMGRYTVGGTVSGLAGSGLAVSVNGGPALSIVADGGFIFPDAFVAGDLFEVSVVAQPAGQACSVLGGSGVISNSNYGGAFVNCVAASNKAARTASALAFEELAWSFRSAADAQHLPCFSPAAAGTEWFVMTFGAEAYDLLPMPGAEELTGCGSYLVSLDEHAGRVHVMNLLTHRVSVYSTEPVQSP